MKTSNKLNVAVFPFKNLVLYPHASIPLYIFEPTYVRMIKECMEKEMPIAVGIGESVKDHSGKEVPNILTPKKIMGIGRPIIVEEYEDGSLYVIIHGMGKVALDHVQQNLPFLICEATKLDDRVVGPQAFVDAPIERLSKILNFWLDANVPDEEQREAFHERITSAHHVVDYLSMFLIQDPALKQILLESDTLAERIRILDMLIKDEDMSGENIYYGKIIKTFEELEQNDAIIQ